MTTLKITLIISYSVAMKINMVVKLRTYKMNEYTNIEEKNVIMTGSVTPKVLGSVLNHLKCIWLMSFCRQEK